MDKPRIFLGSSGQQAKLLQALTPPAPAQQSKPMDGRSAAGVLAEHMSKQPQDQLMTPDKLYALSTSKDVPPKVAEAAKFMLNHPQVFKTPAKRRMVWPTYCGNCCRP